MRLVNKCIKIALETNPSLDVILYVSQIQSEKLLLDFLLRWKGVLHVYFKKQWQPCCAWLLEFKMAFISGMLRAPKTLGLVVEGAALHSLSEALADLRPKIEHLNLSYRGNREDLLAESAALPALGCIVTMDIFDLGKDLDGTQTRALLRRLSELKIGLRSISLRFLPHRAPAAHALTSKSVCRSEIWPCGFAINAPMLAAFPALQTLELGSTRILSPTIAPVL